jgi:hypothetical protein
LIVVAGLCLLLFSSAGNALAQPIRVMVNGERVRFEDVTPIEMNGRVLVPVRGVLEQLGADVSWRPETQRVIASNDDVTIQLRLGDRRARVNGKDVWLDVPARTYEDRTMVPLRFLGEALGATVRWNEDERTVYITTSENASRTRNHRSRNDRDNNYTPPR